MNRILALLFLLSPAFVLANGVSDALHNSSRPEADQTRDDLRQPQIVLENINVAAGATVLDMGAGGGYYSELFSHLVGDQGRVIMQNPSQLYEIFPNLHAAITDQRLANNRLANTRLINSEATELDLDDASVDLVFFHLIYHDMFWLYPQQVNVINQEIHRVLKPGGRLVIIDHDSISGARASQTLSRQGSIHRLEDAFVEESLSAAGFTLERSFEDLRVAGDDHSKPFFDPEMSGKPTDRFFHIYRR